MQVVYRPAAARDVEQLIEVTQRSFLSAFWKRSPIEVIKDWVAQDFEANHYPVEWPRMTVAEVGGKPVGVVDPVGDHISGIWIHPDFHRKGIGRNLMRSAEDSARENGHMSVWLECSEFNADAHPFYQALGYQVAGERTDRLSTGIDERLTRYQKQLSAR